METELNNYKAALARLAEAERNYLAAEKEYKEALAKLNLKLIKDTNG